METIARFRPGVVICDLAMPGMNGYEVATTVRAMYGDSAPVLMAYTGYGNTVDRTKSVAAGFAYHLTKPVELDELVRALNSVLGRRNGA